MPKKRIPIEIKPNCRNCLNAIHCDGKSGRNPCNVWIPKMGWLGRKIDAAEKKLGNAKKAAKKPKPRQDDDEDEWLDVY